MRCAAIGFALGVCGLQMQTSLPGTTVLLLCLLAALASMLALRGLPRAAVTGLLCGFAWAAGHAHLALRQSLPLALEGRDIVVTAVVSSLPHRSEGAVRFQAQVQQVHTPGATVPERLILSWYGQAPVALAPGQAWQWTVRLQRPHGNANPYGFDYEAWLLGQGIRATGYVRAGSRLAHDDPHALTHPGYQVERARGWLRERIVRILEGQAYAGVVTALVIGEQRAISQSDWEVFNRTGISHLVSISGLHITMVAALAAAMVSIAWRRLSMKSVALPLRLPAQKAAAVAGALVAFVYVALAGFGVPAQRTLMMLLVVATALWSARQVAASHILCLALLGVLLLDPWAVLWPGFWLSFGAVACILYACGGRMGQALSGWRATVVAAARTQWAVTVGLAPLTLLLFGQISLVAPLANALAIPIVSLCVTPLALIGSVLPEPLAHVVLHAAHLALELLAAILAWLSAFDWAVWRAPMPGLWQSAAALIGAAWLLAPRGWPYRWTALAAFSPVVSQLPTAPHYGQFTVTALDVGQGMALLVETSSHRLLYDTGPAYGPGANAGSRVILPYLRGRGVNRLDMLLLSHSDLDHTGGAQAVLDGVKVARLLSSLPVNHRLLQAAPAHTRCQAGQRWRWDGVQFEMLGPSPATYARLGARANARSCVLRISNGHRSMLLAGDIEAAQESELLRRVPQSLRAHVLLAPHHGSGTSSTQAFLSAVAPTVAVFQVGHRNRYRHPQAAVYGRYQALGVARLRTDHSGAITLRFGYSINIVKYREQRRRYWHEDEMWSRSG